MPAEHHIDNNSKLIFTTWHGEVNDIDMLESLKRYQEDIQSNPDYIEYGEVIDFTQAASTKLTIAGLKNLGKIAANTDHKDIKRKLALIVTSNTFFFLARMYKAYRSFSTNSNKEVSVFTSEEEACKWVQNKSDN